MDRRDFLISSATAVASGMAAPAFAQVGSGEKPVRLLVGFSPGGGADNVARLIAAHMQTAGIPAIVENKTGAGGRLAAMELKNSTPDGKTVLITPDGAVTLFPYTFKNLGYDPNVDFRPVSEIAAVPMTFAVGPMVPASVKTLADFARWCKTAPEKAAYGTAGAGTNLHFVGAMYAQANGIEFTHVPYRSAQLAAQDMIAGQVAAAIGVLGDLLPLLSAGKVRILAVSSPARSKLVPDVPTFREAGYPDFESTIWYGAFVHARTPDPATDRLNAAISAASRSPAMLAALEALGFEIKASSAASLAATMKNDQIRWSGAVRKTGYTASES
jgi:tripartite-type tricarboxylate transporter receptor subunit TctC